MSSLMLIGTAHVIDLSSPLEGFIRDFNPDIVALELDRNRWFALQSNNSKREGPLFLKLLASFQKYLGDSFGSSPGNEMLVAANIAKSLGGEVHLIDKPILPTLRDAWKNMPWNEFWSIIKDSCFSLIGQGTSDFSQSMKSGDFSKELEQFSSEYPVIKSHLIDRRDTYMSKNIVKLFRKKNNSKIVAIVGEGHIDGMAKKLSSINPKIIRLSDLLSRKDNTVSFSIKI
tara:strand:+ start:77 stop:763 length:687 start_codon:yes stop_codon:yes gene_type:complete